MQKQRGLTISQDLTQPRKHPVTRQPARSDCDRSLSLADGRTLGYSTFGDSAGRPVIALHGTPGSRFKYAASHTAAADRSLCLIAFDRWGYGLSSPRPGAPLAAFGTDMLEAIDRLGLDTVAVTGISGGGPFAVATAAALGPRATALALVAPVGPLTGLPNPPRISVFHAACFKVLPRLPGAVAAAFGLYRAGLTIAPDFAMWLALSRSTAVDRAAIRDETTRARLIATFKGGLMPGVAGPQADMALFGQPWGIDVSTVRAPTRIWIGLDDRNVPLTAVRRLAEALPSAQLTELPGAGHLWVSQNADVVLAWLEAAINAPQHATI